MSQRLLKRRRPDSLYIELVTEHNCICCLHTIVFTRSLTTILCFYLVYIYCTGLCKIAGDDCDYILNWPMSAFGIEHDLLYVLWHLEKSVSTFWNVWFTAWASAFKVLSLWATLNTVPVSYESSVWLSFGLLQSAGHKFSKDAAGCLCVLPWPTVCTRK